MFNREYQKRATQQGRQEFYRPLQRPIPSPEQPSGRGRGRLAVSPLQMKLDFSADRPLNDLFPEAYE